MKITIDTTPSHRKEAGVTVGDYWYTEDGDLEIRVSELGSWQEEALIAIHELVEVILVKDRGINLNEIDAFDYNSLDEEPGSSVLAPYHEEHVVADIVERIMAKELGIEMNYV